MSVATVNSHCSVGEHRVKSELDGWRKMRNAQCWFFLCVSMTELQEWKWWSPAHSPQCLGAASETLATYYEVFSYLSALVSQSVLLPRSTCLSHVLLITKPATACKYMRCINYCWRLCVCLAPLQWKMRWGFFFSFFLFFSLCFSFSRRIVIVGLWWRKGWRLGGLQETSPSLLPLTKTLILHNYTDRLKYTARQGITPIMQSWLKPGPHARPLQGHGRGQGLCQWRAENRGEKKTSRTKL